MRRRPILRLKAWAAGKFAERTVRRQLRRTPEGREAEQAMKDFLAGKKQIIVHVLGLITMILGTLGVGGEWIPYVQRLHDAVASGDPMAVIGAFVAVIVFAAGIFGRMAKNRQHAEVVAKLDAIKG